MIKKVIGRVSYLCIRLIRKIFPPFDIFCLHYFAEKKGNIIIKAKTVPFAEFCLANDGMLTILEKEQDRVVYEPAYYGKTEGKEHIFKSKSVYIAELNNVSILGGTGLVLSGNKVITDICVNDSDNRVQYVSGAIRRADRNWFYLEAQSEVEEIGCAINLCGLAACNYYHLTFEILSRYGYIKDYLDDCNIPVLVDAGIRKYSQFVDLAKTILENRQIIFVPEYKRIRCRRLIQPSMNTWMPMNVKRKNDFRMSDNLIAKSAIENIREATKTYRLERENKKIFISRRKTSLSRITNEVEVAELFRQNGFQVICTEDLSYKEQVELFSSASCIVGASGAALTNLVYCNSGAVFGCIIPKKYGFCIYSSIAHLLGCKILYLDARVEKSGTAISIEQCRVDMDECREYIKELNKMMKGET